MRVSAGGHCLILAGHDPLRLAAEVAGPVGLVGDHLSVVMTSLQQVLGLLPVPLCSGPGLSVFEIAGCAVLNDRSIRIHNRGTYCKVVLHHIFFCALDTNHMRYAVAGDVAVYLRRSLRISIWKLRITSYYNCFVCQGME